MRRCWRSRHLQDVARRRAAWGFLFPWPHQTKLDCFCPTTNGRRSGTPCGSALSKLPVINMKFAQNRHFYKVSTANITYHTGAYRRYGIWCRGERKLPHIGFAQNVKWLKTECGHSTTFTPHPSYPSLSPAYQYRTARKHPERNGKTLPASTCIF